MDSRVNAIDLTYFQRSIAQWVGYEEDKVDAEALDLNYDGRVNALDAAVFARHIAGWIGYETLPYKK